jgi:predicted O-methyltransferase YrrM
MPGTLIWSGDERCVVGDLTFQILPSDLFDQDQPRIPMGGADFLLFKHRQVVQRYVDVIEELRPQRIFELGILEGGSTALLSELAHPQVLIGVDRSPPKTPALSDYISGRKLEEVIRIHPDVDQADRGRLAEIAEDAFGDEPLDLVVDDCSHMYDATRESFNELFPRLRPGGLYLIEDWDWTREEKIAEMWADRVPLTRLIQELVLALGSSTSLISEISIAEELVQVRRGDADIDPRGFDVVAARTPAARAERP